MKHKIALLALKPWLFLKWVGRSIKLLWLGNWLRKLIVIIIGFLLFAFIFMYSIATWYKISQSSKPLIIGTSFVPAYAESLGLDAHQTLNALTDDLGIKDFRLVGYWNQLEPSPGVYDFSSLDWQFSKIESINGSISLSLGLRQPRWPECHMPGWVEKLSDSKWQESLNNFISKVVERYKDSPALVSYQLENEYFLSAFGECPNFDRKRLVNEFNLTKKLDSAHPIIVSRSNNGLGIPLGQPRPDMSAISIYRVAWNTNLYTGYFRHPEPAWYYAFLAGLTKITTGKDTIIHELQAEPWPPSSQPITKTTLAEHNQSFNAKSLKSTVEYGKATGMRQIYLWGSEYWYYRKTVLKDPSVWNTAKDIFNK